VSGGRGSPWGAPKLHGGNSPTVTNERFYRSFVVTQHLVTATSQHTDPLPRCNWASACTGGCRALNAIVRERARDRVVHELCGGAPIGRRTDRTADDEHVGSCRRNL